MDLFERILSVTVEDIEIELRSVCSVPWADFLLNPRRLRGSDFLMRWSQGAWSERRLTQAVNETDRYFALPYGPSGVAPNDDIQESELYFERLSQAGLGQLKRPDLLIFRQSDQHHVEELVTSLGGTEELPFTGESDERMEELLSRAIIAVECENSLWKARQMPDYGSELRPMRRLGGQLGLPKSAVLPTVIIKGENLIPLSQWQEQSNVNIHIWHVFYDMAFGLALDTAEELIQSGKIEPREQVFQAPGGATTRKTTYNFYYHYAYPLAESREEPNLVADYIVDRNGHILPYVRFEGGRLVLIQEAFQVLDKVS